MATTPKTVRTYPLNGAKDFTIPFEYLARKFVVVTLIGATRRELIPTTEFRFSTPTTITTNKAWGSADGFDLIEIRRFTSATERLVEFSDGSILKAYDLNISTIQSLHIAEEARDLTADTIAINNDGNLDARAKRIVNLGDAIDDGDAVTLRQQKEWANSALNYSLASANSAQAAAQAAAAAQSFQDNAVTAANSSAAYRDAAEGYKDQAGTFKDAAEASNQSAGVHESNAQKWASNPEDTVVSGGLFSSFHYSRKAAASAAAAATSATNAATQVTNATTQADRAKTEADRAKTEADKLANFNAFAANTRVNGLVSVYDTADNFGYSTATFDKFTPAGPSHSGREGYTLFVEGRPAGSGYADVPSSDFSLGVSMVKKDWRSSLVQGQTCGINVVTRGGYHGPELGTSWYGPGDTAALITNSVVSHPNSFVAILEGVSYYMPNGNQVVGTKGMRVQLGAIKESMGIQIGVLAVAVNGACSAAIQTQDNQDATAGHGRWTNIHRHISLTADGSTSFESYLVTPNGRTKVSNNVNGYSWGIGPNGNFSVNSKTEVPLMLVDPNGNLTVGADLIIGSTHYKADGNIYGGTWGDNLVAWLYRNYATLSELPAQYGARVLADGFGCVATMSNNSGAAQALNAVLPGSSLRFATHNAVSATPGSGSWRSMSVSNAGGISNWVRYV